MRSVYLNVSTRLYGWLLFAYPSHFRQRFGGEMRQTFRDCIYSAANRETLIGFWLRTLVDLFVTAAQERADNSERKGNIMNNWRRDVMALLGCAGIILIAVLLLNYGKQNEVSSILVFGYILDALIVSGVIGNFIIFLLARTTKLNRWRTALATFAIVHAALLLLVFIIGQRIGDLHVNAVVLAYVVSFLFWTVLHWAWHRTDVRRQQEQV
jgi:O-antigen/teichoic acid export membrane protein